MVKQRRIFSLALLKHRLKFNVFKISMIAVPHTVQVRCRSADWEKSHRKEGGLLLILHYLQQP